VTKESIYTFLRQHKLAVLATTSKEGQPQAALIGFAVTPELEIVFDTVRISRKYANLVAHPQIALVIGWENETTVQYEGVATEITDKHPAIYRETYFSTWPDGKDRAAGWPDLTHFVIKPEWVRYCNYNEPTLIREWTI
jgi:pyridoxine/pyridoxamine 5'-phosphate oxidase